MYIITDVPKDILNKLDVEINKKSLEKWNENLAGNIKKELLIPKAKEIYSLYAFQQVSSNQCEKAYTHLH